MIYIYKNNLNPLKKFSLKINKTKNNFSISLYRKYKDLKNNEFVYTCLERTITKNELKNRNDFVDFSEFGLYLSHASITNISLISELFDFAEEYHWDAETLKMKIKKFLSKFSSEIIPVGYTTLINITKTKFIFNEEESFINNLISSVKILHFFVPFISMTMDQYPLIISSFNDEPIETTNRIEFSNKNSILDNEIIHIWMKSMNIPIPMIGITEDKVTRISEISIPQNSTKKFYLRLFDKLTGNDIINYPTTIFINYENGFINKTKIDFNYQNRSKANFILDTKHLSVNDKIFLYPRFTYLNKSTETVIIIKN